MPKKGNSKQQNLWFLADLRQILKKRFWRIAALAVLLLPLIYGALYLWAFWDPYGRLDRLPVALVNQDHCVSRKSASDPEKKQSRTDEQLCAGQESLDALLEEAPLQFTVTDLASAQKGLAEHRFDAIAIFPEDFSQRLLTADSLAPEQAEIIFQARPASNFMAYKLIDSAFQRIKASLNQKLSETYLNDIFASTRDSLSDLETAKDGSQDLWSGLTEAQTGSQDLLQGGQDLYEGEGSLRSGLNDLSNGMLAFRAGMNEVQAGKTLSFNAGIDQAATGSQTLASALLSLAKNQEQFSTALQALPQEAAQLNAGAAQVSTGITAAEQILASALAIDPSSSQSAAIQQALLVLQSSQAGQQQLLAGLSQLQTESPGIASASTQLATASKQTAQGAADLASGLSDIKVGKDQLWSATTDLQDGLFSATSGSNDLVLGMQDWLTGQEDLKTGLVEAATGAADLAQGLSDAVEETAEETAPSRTEAEAQMMAEPVILADLSYDLVANNGTGFAPYFIPLALWVGAMALFFVIVLPEKAALTWKELLSKFLAWSILASLQALLLGVILWRVLGLTVLLLPEYFALLLLLAFCYLGIQFLLNYSFGLAGKFLSIVLLMLQLTSCGGSYPLPTVSDFFQQLSPFLPMTYATAALREVISGADRGYLWQQLWVLIGITIGVYAASIAVVFGKGYASRFFHQKKRDYLGRD